MAFSVEILPANVWLCASRFPKNRPPSLVALLNAAVTMSAVIAPCAIPSFNLATEMPVCFEISVNGLKPWFMSWSKSWPMSLPVLCICPNTRARPSSLFLSAPATSPSILSVGTTLSASSPKAMSVLPASARPCLENGVFAANSDISAIKSRERSAEPAMTVNWAFRDSIDIAASSPVFAKSVKPAPIARPPTQLLKLERSCLPFSMPWGSTWNPSRVYNSSITIAALLR